MPLKIIWHMSGEVKYSHLYTSNSEHFCLPYRLLHITSKQNILTDQCVIHILVEKLVRPRRLELPLRLKNSDLNAARLPIPPRPHMVVAHCIPIRSRNEKRALFRFAKFLPPGLATLRQTSLMRMSKE